MGGSSSLFSRRSVGPRDLGYTGPSEESGDTNTAPMDKCVLFAFHGALKTFKITRRLLEIGKCQRKSHMFIFSWKSKDLVALGLGTHVVPTGKS